MISVDTCEECLLHKIHLQPELYATLIYTLLLMDGSHIDPSVLSQSLHLLYDHFLFHFCSLA